MARNAAYHWDLFDPKDYLRRNYAPFLDVDRRILQIVRDFFSRQSFGTRARGVDVGTGTNLYPALAMLPFCSTISLLEHAPSNRAWLSEQLATGDGFEGVWDKFWHVLTEQEPYGLITDPWARLCRTAQVRACDILRPPDGEKWDVGTMFFVAESITTVPDEFHAALRNFCGLLVPGAPFAITFMENSAGYEVGHEHFPGYAVGMSRIRDELWNLGTELEFRSFDVGTEPLRDGYTGMILVLGHAK
ncbi:SCO2525 family SAM-dependent methyltransferase [Actinacidiphila alni]|uniref:SCO2525 family SAM-dependent methyltransferase n=1 Tax=Actinacidiphila alni TaxID=380248 RepID=UPI0033D4859E